MRPFREKPLPPPVLRRWDELESGIMVASDNDVPVWVSVVFKGFLWILAIVFFPVTLLLIWGYRTGRFTWGVGGQAIDPDEIDDFLREAADEPTLDDVDWAAVHRGDQEPPEKIKVPEG